MNLNILITDPDNVPEYVKKELSKIGNVYCANIYSDMGKKKLASIDILWIALNYKIDKSFLNHCNKLTDIVTVTTGTDHIDIKEIKERKIRLHSLKGHNIFLNKLNATAEHTWALLLSLIRKINSSSNSVKKGNWDRNNFKSTELKNKKIGILGMGRIGKKVTKYAKSFEMDILSYDPYCNKFPKNVKKVETIKSLLQKIDILSIHVHLNNETRNLINANTLKFLHKDSIIINTSRGGIINEFDLAVALREKKIAGCALDVLSDEFNISSSPIHKLYRNNHENLLITPHVGGLTHESRNEAEIFMAKIFTKSYKNINK